MVADPDLLCNGPQGKGYGKRSKHEHKSCVLDSALIDKETILPKRVCQISIIPLIYDELWCGNSKSSVHDGCANHRQESFMISWILPSGASVMFLQSYLN